MKGAEPKRKDDYLIKKSRYSMRGNEIQTKANSICRNIAECHSKIIKITGNKHNVMLKGLNFAHYSNWYVPD